MANRPQWSAGVDSELWAFGRVFDAGFAWFDGTDFIHFVQVHFLLPGDVDIVTFVDFIEMIEHRGIFVAKAVANQHGIAAVGWCGAIWYAPDPSIDGSWLVTF